MFAIGDRVVYPMHGAGVIESIEEKQVQTNHGFRKWTKKRKMLYNEIKNIFKNFQKTY